jgi:hypothetical protein
MLTALLHATASQDSSGRRLASIKSLTCTFARGVLAKWNGGEPEVNARTTALTLSFKEIDAEEGSAQLMDPLGSVDVIVKLSGNGLHFMQSLPEGAVYLTSVFDKETRDGKLRAVHTRHAQTDVALPGFTSSPEQYYGECQAGN